MRAMSKLHGLDAFRGALALIVLVAHGRQIFMRSIGPDLTANLVMTLVARGAVLAFFCLSGYVIALSLHANRRRNGRLDLPSYAMARFARIAPPLLVVIVLTFVIHFVLSVIGMDYSRADTAPRFMYETDPVGQLLALLSLGIAGNLTGIWLNGPLWSLTYEIQLYVVAGLLAWIAWGKPYGKALAAALLLLYVFHISVWAALDLHVLCFFAFGAGSAAYLLRDAPRRVVTGAMFVSLAVSVVLALNARSLLDVDRSMLPSQAAFSVAMACLVLIVRNAKANANAFLVNAGGYSYTLYIGHFPLLLAMWFVIFHTAPVMLTAQWAWLTAAAALAVTWLALASLGRWVERPDLFRRRVNLAPLPAQ